MDIGKLLTDEEITAEVPFGGGESPALITLRFVSSERMQGLLKKATKIAWNDAHQRADKVDNDLFRRLLGEAAVLGWSGILADGQEVPFSAEKRDLMMSKWTDFAKFVVETCDDLQALVAAQRENARGN